MCRADEVNALCCAMACATPVIVTPDVGLAQAVTHAAAGLVTDGSPDVLARALNSLLSDPERCHAMGAAGRRLAMSTFSWDAIAERTEQMCSLPVRRR